MVYFVFTIIAYLSMFVKYVRSKRNFAQNNNTSIFQIFIRSRFFIPVLLISTYLVFVIIPLIIAYVMMYNINNVRERKRILTIIFQMNTVLFPLSCTADVIIYIFLQQSVRQLLYEKMSCLKYLCVRMVVRPLSNADRPVEVMQMESL